MKIAIPKEIFEDEKRVAGTPETVKKLVSAGFSVSVESGAGKGCSISDAEYEKAGAKIDPSVKSLLEDADIVLKVRKPAPNTNLQTHEIDLMKPGALLITLLQPLVNPDLVRKLTERKVTCLSMDSVPRIARAQKLDALSSQSSVAGYKAVLMAANELGKMMPLMMTAAGTIAAAKVFVIGAGVAGLQAIATAKRLGAIVEAYDVRPVVKEQVESLGAKFVSLDIQVDAEDKGGYAKELSQDAKKRGEELIAVHVKNADMVITTALIPGKPSPRLITRAMVESMKPGSVIVDLAVEGGGNCELTQAGENVDHQGVTIMGPPNVPGLMAGQSSQLYSRNVLNLLMEIADKGSLQWDHDNEVIRGALVTQDGKVVHPQLLSLRDNTQVC